MKGMNLKGKVVSATVLLLLARASAKATGAYSQKEIALQSITKTPYDNLANLPSEFNYE